MQIARYPVILRLIDTITVVDRWYSNRWYSSGDNPKCLGNFPHLVHMSFLLIQCSRCSVEALVKFFTQLGALFVERFDPGLDGSKPIPQRMLLLVPLRRCLPAARFNLETCNCIRINLITSVY